MLIRFRVENFRSIYAEQELSLVASPLSERAETLVHVDRYDMDLLRAAAVYGPNASGKSTLFHALAFMKAVVTESHRQWAPDAAIPRVPFALDPTAATEPSLFAVDLLLDGVRYEYGFVTDSTRILEEWLYAYPRGRKQEWFTRDAAREEEFAFSRLLPGANRTISSFTRPNSLFLSAAAQNNHPALEPIYAWFSRLFIMDEGSRSMFETVVVQLCMDETFRTGIQAFLQAADLGIADIEMIEEELTSFASRFNMRVDDPMLRELFPSSKAGAGIQLRHRTGGDADVSLPFDQESQGTRAMFALAGTVIVALRAGSVLVVDELDRSLHPLLALATVSVFTGSVTNPKNAQLIFNTHDTNLLDQSILRRDQIWFTEKGDDGATRLYPLTDFRARKHENLERGYLQGRYGAVPAVGDAGLAPVGVD